MNLHFAPPRLSPTPACILLLAALALSGCSKKPEPTPAPAQPNPTPHVAFYTVDPATAGEITGTVRMTGPHPAPKLIDMSEDPACVKAHKGKAYDESLVVSRHGDVDNAFVYIKSGLDGKRFPIPDQPITLDQSGCWFHPRVLGIEVGQVLQVVNSDPVTHNIHPMGEANREWNHSQGPGDPPLIRHFLKPEVMIPVKCNIHSWMHAFIGVVDNPYFAVTRPDGSFQIANLPPGTYTLGIWQQTLGTSEQQVTVASHSKSAVTVTLKGKK